MNYYSSSCSSCFFSQTCVGLFVFFLSNLAFLFSSILQCNQRFACYSEPSVFPFVISFSFRLWQWYSCLLNSFFFFLTCCGGFLVKEIILPSLTNLVIFSGYSGPLELLSCPVHLFFLWMKQMIDFVAPEVFCFFVGVLFLSDRYLFFFFSLFFFSLLMAPMIYTGTLFSYHLDL